MEFFHNPKFDFLGKKAWFVGMSAVLVAVSVISLVTRGLEYGIDFRGGADLVLTFVSDPDIDQIRKVLSARGFEGAQIQKLRRAEDPNANDLLIRVAPQSGEGEQTTEQGDVSGKVLAALRSGLASAEAASGKIDLNLTGAADLKRVLAAAFPGQDSMVEGAVTSLADYRTSHGSLIKSMDEARSIPGVPPEVAGWIRDNAVAGSFAIRSVDYVGPSVGQELKSKARYAIVGSLLAMLAYIWFRFDKLAYGISAAVTLAHDALVALGAVSLTGKEFDLTVLAAILTIVGYSINDTIVTFDRVRENLKTRRGDTLEKLFNDSINQTLGRTILTSGLVIMMVMVLWLFGGSRLNPFSFTLLVGVIVGSYSTIYVSAPVVIWWRRVVEKKATV